MLRALQVLEDYIRAILAVGFLAVYGIAVYWTVSYGYVSGTWEPFYAVLAAGIPQIVLTYYFSKASSL